MQYGGPERGRTADLYTASVALSQLSYGPTNSRGQYSASRPSNTAKFIIVQCIYLALRAVTGEILWDMMKWYETGRLSFLIVAPLWMRKRLKGAAPFF